MPSHLTPIDLRIDIVVGVDGELPRKWVEKRVGSFYQTLLAFFCQTEF